MVVTISNNPCTSLQDFSHPMKNANIVCDNQRCKSSDRTAVAICFSQDCAMFNATDHRPVRYCTQCNKMNHQENTSRNS